METYQGQIQLDALGDRSRRTIVELLAEGPTSVGELAARLPISRPAVSQHLRVLERAGLVRHRRKGTRHIHELDPAGPAAIRAYLDRYWSRSLAAFAEAVIEDSLRSRPSDPRNDDPEGSSPS